MTIYISENISAYYTDCFFVIKSQKLAAVPGIYEQNVKNEF